jgi:quinoprotein glucose dehydrogenase
MDHQGSSYEQLTDLTPELKKKALDNVQFLDLGPVYTAATARGLLASPTSLGGANWGGSAFDPETGILYTPTRTTTQILRQRPPAPGTPAAAAPPAAPVHGAGPTPPANLASLLYVDDLPLFRPPYARVTALDLNKGSKVWVTPIGNGPRNHPALKGLAKLPPLGDAILGGSPLVTKTMLFVGVTYTFVTGMPQPVPWEKWSDPGFQKNVLYAYDKKTGKQLAVFTADNLGAAGPMTYLYKGKQYLALATGNGPDSELVAYALP